jgi:hypothetical protein
MKEKVDKMTELCSVKPCMNSPIWRVSFGNAIIKEMDVCNDELEYYMNRPDFKSCEGIA